ncbi:MAG: hypothetical protein QGD91_11715 [Actinomycetota bacterium]|nr:hypothetical protein [Actinomycetota bacterium]
MKGSLRVLKIPVPNSNHFAIRVKGHLVECLEFQAQVFKDTNILLAKGGQIQKIAVFVWCLIIEDDQEETHEFVMVKTGEDFPMMDGDIQYIASTLVPLPDGNQIEMHLFHAGINEEMAKIDIPFPEEANNDG